MENNNKARIVFLDSYTTNPGDLRWTALEQLGEFVHYKNVISHDEIISCAKDADIIILNKAVIGREELEHLTRVKLICVAATGYNSVDVEACRVKGIPVCNVSGYSSPAVAQQVFALILNIRNKVQLYSDEVSKGDWSNQEFFTYQHQSWFELKGKTFGILGLGKIGEEVANIALAFGMHVIAYRKNQAKGAPAGVQLVELDQLFQDSDILSLHSVLNEETKGIINQEVLSKMKSNSILINTGRGGLVVEEDLKEALLTKQIFAAGLDVLSAEPPPKDHILFGLENCIITPHQAWGSFESRTRLVEGLAQNIRAFQESDLINVVN